MSEPSFLQLQRRWAAYLRDPDVVAPPGGIEDRRLQIYRDLLYNTVESLLRQAFPVLRRISTDTAWHRRVRAFYARHRCRQPQLHRMTEDFVAFAAQDPPPLADDFPFLAELCHYEWVELALAVSDEHDALPDGADATGDLLDGRPLLSPLARVLGYRWPVHRIGPGFLPETPPDRSTWLIVYRDWADTVRFLEISALTAALLQGLEADPAATGRQALVYLAAQLGHADAGALVQAGAGVLQQLREQGVLLGTRSPVQSADGGLLASGAQC